MLRRQRERLTKVGGDSPLIEGATATRATPWLWLSLPIVVLALGASLAGIVARDTYAHETPNWQGQAVGQDIANLLGFVILGVLAIAAARGSTGAYLAWTGLVAFSVYSFAIYAFAVHFGRFFLVYVAVFGLSVWALIGGLSATDPSRVKAMFSPNVPIRSTAIVLIVIASLFYLLWLSEIVPTIGSGTVPKALREAGLLTNPVHVIDMAVLLPAAILTGVLLLRRSAWGFVLAPTILGCFIFLGVTIVAAIFVLRGRGEAGPMGVALAVSVLTVVETVVLVRFLGALSEG
jgi:hypothetical protein